jgi:purine-binding chemotaxis protein CheW
MSRECITFKVGGQVFGLDIGIILDIRNHAELTRVPGLPAYVAGVTTLNGAILPVIDLAARLGWAPTPPGDGHDILLVRAGNRSCGLMVEEVGDLVLIEQAALRPPPALGDRNAPHFVEGLVAEGLATLPGRMVQLLDIGALARGDIMGALDSA